MFESKDVPERISLSDILYSHEEIAASISSKLPVLPLFKRYLEKGYYPSFRRLKLEDYRSRLLQMLTTAIDMDIPATEKSVEYETLIKLKRLIYIVSSSQPFVPNISTLSQLIGTNRCQTLRLLNLLEKAGIIRQIFISSSNARSLAKPKNILLNNSSLMYALTTPQVGAVRECAFASLVSVDHEVGFAKASDFLIDGRYVFEVGGKDKGFSQIKNIPDSYVVADDIEFGFGNKIPLWLFGLLY